MHGILAYVIAESLWFVRSVLLINTGENALYFFETTCNYTIILLVSTIIFIYLNFLTFVDLSYNFFQLYMKNKLCFVQRLILKLTINLN